MFLDWCDLGFSRLVCFVFFVGEDGIVVLVRSCVFGDVYIRQGLCCVLCVCCVLCGVCVCVRMWCVWCVWCVVCVVCVVCVGCVWCVWCVWVVVCGGGVGGVLLLGVILV